MSLRLPTGSRLDEKTALRSGAHLLETELMIEKGNALGRAGRAVEDALAQLAAIEAGQAQGSRAEQIENAAYLVWELIIQQEACGMRDVAMTYRHYKVPKDVQAKVGSVKPRAGPLSAGVSFLTYLK
jgi:hypothetical protein